ncbi:MAG: triose-phosphate isomerase [Patescibacteria group bacterium]|nr:triose-phosphate isomerase [Patescibacteria group bacterium]
MKKRLVVANWKMNPESLSQAFKLAGAYKPSRNSQLVVCPPGVFLQPLSQRFGRKMAFGGQDCLWEQEGAYTGGISPAQLRSAGARYVILGHSERRKYFAEDDKMVNCKLRAALAAGLTPFLCLGGGLSAGVSESKLKIAIRRQFRAAVGGLKSLSRTVLVFEPAYAISTFGGKRVSADEVAGMAGFLRRLATQRFGSRVAAVSVLYGGSVDKATFKSYRVFGRIDGFLVGGASLRPDEFKRILQEFDI